MSAEPWTHHAPRLLLVCLGDCAGEFYLPMLDHENATCPVDATHPVRVYEAIFDNTPEIATEEPTDG
jgi:hypothetical protein